jgi:hypothetical protein
MNPEVKKLWLEALRSGNYEQTRFFLRDKRGYCCLGVLCDLHPDVDWSRSTPGVAFYPFDEDEMDLGILPDKASSWSGLTDEQRNILMNMNDDGKSFEEIADYIENNID